jgi:hypothetical protein
MLIIIDIIWFIVSLKDFVETARRFRLKYILESLEEYTVGFILLHLLMLFGCSLGLFIKGLG